MNTEKEKPLTRRLRGASRRHDRAGRGRTGHLLREAADAIEHLEDELHYLSTGEEVGG